MKTTQTLGATSMTHTEINQNLLNNSATKMQYSFSKTKRFKSENKLFTQAHFYDIPSAREQRAPTFGLGNKITFDDKRIIPASNTYTLESDFCPQKTKKRGISFGVGREKAKSNCFRGSDAPGPGSYNPEVKLHPVSALMMGKVRDHSLDQKIKVPGPGQYNQPLLSQSRKTIESKYSNPRFPVISKQPRSQTQKSQTPSPFSYNTLGIAIKKDPSSSKFGKFSTTKRTSFFQINDTPGPGYQQILSNLAIVFLNFLDRI